MGPFIADMKKSLLGPAGLTALFLLSACGMVTEIAETDQSGGLGGTGASAASGGSAGSGASGGSGGSAGSGASSGSGGSAGTISNCTSNKPTIVVKGLTSQAVKNPRLLPILPLPPNPGIALTYRAQSASTSGLFVRGTYVTTWQAWTTSAPNNPNIASFNLHQEAVLDNVVKINPEGQFAVLARTKASPQQIFFGGKTYPQAQPSGNFASIEDQKNGNAAVFLADEFGSPQSSREYLVGYQTGNYSLDLKRVTWDNNQDKLLKTTIDGRPACATSPIVADAYHVGGRRLPVSHLDQPPLQYLWA